ncbi:MAG: sensor histidine kinase [Microcoleaceae cyanobacterium]
MKDLGQVLLSKIDSVIEQWIDKVRKDKDIESSKTLTYNSVRNSLPVVLEAIATLLTDSKIDQSQKVEKNSLEHGIVRAEQGYDATEIIHEYRLLRQVLFAVLESDLLSGTAAEVLQAVRQIDGVLDEVIFLSLESYLEAQIDKLEKMQSQLVLNNQELNRLVQSQKENFSFFAHELKNPLNSIIGFSSLLLQQQQIKFKEQSTSLDFQLIEKMLKNGEQLLRLVNNTLEISRCEAGMIELNLHQIEISPLIRTVVDALEPLADRKELEIIVNLEQAPQQVITDTLRIQQIASNLISNAIRYTDSGKIKVICQYCEPETWQLIIIDTGIGISQGDRERIFQPYFRVGSQGQYLPESTGLGLAIVAKLVDLLSGKIELVSQVGQGSTFTVTFPLFLDS